MNKDVQWAIAQMLEKLSPDFHGTFSLSFTSGRLSTFETRETQKPPVDLQPAVK